MNELQIIHLTHVGSGRILSRSVGCGVISSPREPRQEPAFQAKVKSLPQRRHVTLVTGFLTGNATILCADSQEVVGDYSKSSTQKIRVSNHHNNWVMAIGGAGDAANIDYFEHKLAVNLATVQEFDYQKIIETIESTLYSIHEQHIWPDPNGDRDEFQTLIALQSINPTKRRALLWTHKTKVIPIREYKSIGVGNHLADYIYSQLFPRIGTIYNSLPEQVANLGVYMVQEVKGGIQGVDGETNVLIFYGDSGDMRWMIYDELAEVESWMNHFHLAQLPLMMAIANPRMRQKEFEDELRLFQIKMAQIKEAQADAVQKKDKAYAEWQNLQRLQKEQIERDHAKREQTG